MSKKGYANAYLLFICVSYAWCQQLKKVSGKIVDDLKVPMIGVSVIEKGTSNGVISDLDGNYELQVKEGATIVFLMSVMSLKKRK